MKTFAGIPKKYAERESSEIFLKSIPYDGTSTWGNGANEGFEAFLDAAENMEIYDIETNSEVYKKGIFMIEDSNDYKTPEEMFNSVYQETLDLIKQNKFLTFFGGEHSISIGIIKAFYENYKNLTVLQIDAHADLRPDYDGTAYNHACAVYDASQNCNLIQVGIRSMDKSEMQYLDKDKTFFAHDLFESSDWMNQAISKMTEQVYVTFDLDAFDSSIMPATGTPEPGGLTWDMVSKFLKKIFEQKDVVGFDIVELAPIEAMHAPQYLAAKLYYKMLSYKFHSK